MSALLVQLSFLAVSLACLRVRKRLQLLTPFRRAVGFSVANTTLLGMAPGLSEFIGIVIAVNVARITGSRAWTGFSSEFERFR